MKIGKLLLVGALGLSTSLGGCAEMAKIEASVSNNLPAVCANIDSADAGFQVVVTTQARAGKPLASKVIADENAAMAGAAALCANPSITSTSDLLAKALAIYASVTASLSAAQVQ